MYVDDGRDVGLPGTGEGGADERDVRDVVDAAEAAILVDYLDGMTVPALAQKHRRTNRTISRILRTAGVLGELQRRRDAAKRGQPSPAHLAKHDLAGSLDGPHWAYVAGFFDGDGTLVRRGATHSSDGPAAKGHCRYLLCIIQKDPTPLKWLRGTLGVGRIHFANGTHRYEIASQRAVFEILCALAPHLFVKRTAAQQAIETLTASYGWTLERVEERAGTADEEMGEA
jgi:hypothetical protein